VNLFHNNPNLHWFAEKRNKIKVTAGTIRFDKELNYEKLKTKF